MIDMKLVKIDKRRKWKDEEELTEYKATLRHETGSIKMTVKKPTKQGVESVLGTLKTGQIVQMKLTNNQTRLTDTEESE